MNQQTIKPQYTIATNKYGHYCIPLSSAHRPCAQTILAGDVHEPDTIQFILDHAGDGDVVHAGAYFGDMLPALRLGIPAKQAVFAFEPNPDNYLCAKITCMLNHIPTGYLYNYALGYGQREEAVLKTIDVNGISLGGGSKMQEHSMPSADQYVQIAYQYIKVISKSINLFTKNPSVIHLDIEGYEQEALMGAMPIITRTKPILILETLPDDEWMNMFLFNMGYKITGRVHSNSILECVK